MDVNYTLEKKESDTVLVISLTDAELVEAISEYLISHGIKISGSRRTFVNDELPQSCKVHVYSSATIKIGDSFG